MTEKKKKSELVKNIKIIAELWLRGELSFKLHSSQKRVYKEVRSLSPAVREAVFLISRRWGKSFLITLMAIEDCLRGSGRQVFIVGPDLKHTRKIITPLIKLLTADAPEGLIKQNKSDISWTIGESTLLIGAFDTALESFRGMEAFTIYLEESALASMDDYEYIIKSVLRPTLMHSRGRMVHATTPPREENHPFIYTTMAEAESKNALYRYTIRDNPLLTEKEIEEEIAVAGGEDSPHCRRELFCQIVREASRVVIPEFNDSFIIDVKRPTYANWLTVIDFGGVLDPHAVIICYYDFERNKKCVLDELWLPVNTGTKDIAAAVLELEKKWGLDWKPRRDQSHVQAGAKRVCDAPGQVLVDLRAMGFECRAPSKGKDSAVDGIQSLRVDFLRGLWEIDPRCNLMRQTLQYQMWDKQRKDFQRTELLGHGDMLAALFYANKHLDIQTNPFPPFYHGLSKETHYYKKVEERTTIAKAFNKLFED